MATYAIGDIQGCFYSFQDLLDKISFNSRHDDLWLVGDIVNRGKFSLETLLWCYENQKNIKIVLGNHDLHFLAVFFNQRNFNQKDTLSYLLNSKKINQLVDWVLSWPLLFLDKKHILVHAGIHPCWSIDGANQYAKETCMMMQSDPENFFQNMYGNSPDKWRDDLKMEGKMRFTINSMTRMRCLNKEQVLDFVYNGGLLDLPPTLKPWFNFKSNFKRDKKIISGHWSAIGVYQHPYGVSIDSACVWGKKLTAISLEDNNIQAVDINKKDLN